MSILILSEWNDFLSQHPDTHILQTGEWGELKSAFGWEAVRLADDGIGAQILFRRLPLGLTFGYIPKGPVSEKPSAEVRRHFWDEVDTLCLKRRAIFLKVEQDGWAENEASTHLPSSAFLPSPQHVQPGCTLVIDLHGSEDEIFNRMKPKTRYNIRLAGRKEVTVHTSDNIANFHALMTVTSRRESFHVHSLEYYRRAYELFHPRGLCELFVAEYQGRTLAAVMAFACGKTGYYFYGASADEERNRKPTYPLQWEAIRWAHQRGCTEYDMWGIPDEAAGVDENEAEEREDGLWGVYRFKRGFGGVVRRAIPTFDRVYNPLLYKLYLWRFSGSGSD
ncbi:MAG: peptidoglycan bridge formation glycyltransferase FemA/FemB family protein [Chloroflexota bacterium]